MNPNNGDLYETLAAARTAGVADAVEIVGTPAAVRAISAAVREQHRRKRKAHAFVSGATLRYRPPPSE